MTSSVRMHNSQTTLDRLRKEYHEALYQQVLDYRQAVPTFADPANSTSIQLAQGIMRRLRLSSCPELSPPAYVIRHFVTLTYNYLREAFASIDHLRPGEWIFSLCTDKIMFDQYEHIADLASLLAYHPDLREKLEDCVLIPDIIVGRQPIPEREILAVLDAQTSRISTLTRFRASNHLTPRPILHASISCKWTLRSDRGQNARAEALNLVRNRKGHQPHIVAVTAEPLPTRIASLALGTGDLDCVYHFALPELEQAVKDIDNEDQLDMLNTLVDGQRLRDISDLPFDLAI